MARITVNDTSRQIDYSSHPHLQKSIQGYLTTAMMVNEILKESDRNSAFVANTMDFIVTFAWDDVIVKSLWSTMALANLSWRRSIANMLLPMV
jgi:hypothetical protein